MSPSLAKRLFLAHMELNTRLRRKVTLAEFGEMIARQMGRESPFTAAAVSRWENGTQAPAPEVIEAIAALTHTDPGWISHGDKTAAPPPRGASGSARHVEARHVEAKHVEAKHVEAKHVEAPPEPEGSRIRKRRRS